MRFSQALFIASSDLLTDPTQTAKPNGDALSQGSDISKHITDYRSTPRQYEGRLTQAVIIAQTYLQDEAKKI